MTDINGQTESEYKPQNTDDIINAYIWRMLGDRACRVYIDKSSTAIYNFAKFTDAASENPFPFAQLQIPQPQLPTCNGHGYIEVEAMHASEPYTKNYANGRMSYVEAFTSRNSSCSK